MFNGLASGDPGGGLITYAWTFGDGGTGSGPTPTHAYAANGVYTVILCVTDDDQASECCTKTADVGATPVEPSTRGSLKARYRD